MMGCTDRHCRHLFRLISPETILYSEMVVTGALLHGDAAYHLRHTEDAPCALQLGGSDPGELAQCAKLVAAAGYQEVNLNCGCPSDRVQQGGIGACLMAEPARVAACFSAMQDAVSIPVTIKSRIGIDDCDSYAFFAHFIHSLYDAGCRVFAVHARAAWLQGLSPKENREIPPLRYDYVTRISQELPEATFVLNGGIASCAEALRLLGDHAGVMLGRAPYAKPMLLAALGEALFGRPAATPFAVLEAYRGYLADELRAGTPLRHVVKPLLGLFSGMPGARAYRRCLSEGMNAPMAGVGSGCDAGLALLDAAVQEVAKQA